MARPSLRVALLLLVVIPVVSAEPAKLTLPPARTTRALSRWQLLPGLARQQPGNATEYYVKAYQEFKRIVPDREDRSALSVEMETLRTTPLSGLQEKARKRIVEIAEKHAEALALVRRAARCAQADWGFVVERLRKNGIGALLGEVQQVREFLAFLHLQVRCELLRDHPEQAVEWVADTLSLARQLDECPTLVSHLVAVAIAQIALDMLQDCLQHPGCPGLAQSLALLPRPFLTARHGYEGERLASMGTIPGLQRVLDNPLTQLEPEKVEQILRVYRDIRDDGERRTIDLPPVDRILLARAMQQHHPRAMQALREAGYDADLVQRMPIFNVALIHSLIEYETALAALMSTTSLAVPQAQQVFNHQEKQISRRGMPKTAANETAFPILQYLIPAGEKIWLADLRISRRLEVLRTAELLRDHAARTGSWPDSLAPLDPGLLPNDPVTGKPFAYRRQGDVATILAPTYPANGKPAHDVTLELTLRKDTEQKPAPDKKEKPHE